MVWLQKVEQFNDTFHTKPGHMDRWTPIPGYHPCYRGINKIFIFHTDRFRVWELCESRGGRPGLSVLMSLMVSVDVKQHWVSVDVKHHVYLLKQH